MTAVELALERVRKRIGAAAEACGRRPGSVRLVVVSKMQPVERVAEAIAGGQREFGENYLQDALPKLNALDDREDLVWHFIGQLQSNKTRQAAERFHWVHTIDRLKLIDRLSDQRPHHAAPLNICIQVRSEDDPRASGAVADAANIVDPADKFRVNRRPADECLSHFQTTAGMKDGHPRRAARPTRRSVDFSGPDDDSVPASLYPVCLGDRGGDLAEGDMLPIW